MRKGFWILIILGLVFIISGCTQVALTKEPTITPTVTITASITLSPTLSPSITPSATLTPSKTATDTATLSPSPTVTETITGTPPTATKTLRNTKTPTFTATASRTPTITLTPTPSNTPTPPFSVLRITRPGLMSRVLSPIRIEAAVSKGDDDMVYANLIGEDGRYITQDVFDYRWNVYSRFLIVEYLDFTIDALSEAARLEVYTIDAFGRQIALSSVDLVLLSLGDDQIYPAQSLLEPYLIRYPDEGQVIQGGNLLVDGLINPVNDNPVIIELIKEDQQILASTQITVEPPSGDLSHTSFTIYIPYEVDEATPVRLTIRQESDNRIPGTIALFSLAVILEP